MRRIAIQVSWIACTLVALVSGGVTHATAQRAIPSTAPTVTFTGTIVDTDPLTVATDGQNQRITPEFDVAVTRNGKAATLADLQTNDQIAVTVRNDGTAAAIAATTSSGLPSWLPLVLGVLVFVVLIGLYFRLKYRQEHAPTPNPRPVRRPR